MRNGHAYPSDYTLRFSKRTEHPVTHHAVVDQLRQRFPTEWPYLLGGVHAGRPPGARPGARQAEGDAGRAAAGNASRAGGDREAGARGGGAFAERESRRRETASKIGNQCRVFLSMSQVALLRVE